MKLKTSFEFDAAHRLIGYEGKCSNLHGHMWHVDIEVVGDTKQLDKDGILWDFTNAKDLKNMFDHKTILQNCDENNKLADLLKAEDNELYMMDSTPTAENLCDEIMSHLYAQNSNLKYKVTVWESSKSYCEVESVSQ